MKNFIKKPIFQLVDVVSLCEKCFFHIPTISNCVARNQRYNYENFKKRKCLIDFKILNKPLGKEKTYYFLNKIDRIKPNLKKNFQFQKTKNI